MRVTLPRRTLHYHRRPPQCRKGSPTTRLTHLPIGGLALHLQLTIPPRSLSSSLLHSRSTKENFSRRYIIRLKIAPYAPFLPRRSTRLIILSTRPRLGRTRPPDKIQKICTLLRPFFYLLHAPSAIMLSPLVSRWPSQVKASRCPGLRDRVPLPGGEQESKIRIHPYVSPHAYVTYVINGERWIPSSRFSRWLT